MKSALLSHLFVTLGQAGRLVMLQAGVQLFKKDQPYGEGGRRSSGKLKYWYITLVAVVPSVV